MADRDRLYLFARHVEHDRRSAGPRDSQELSLAARARQEISVFGDRERDDVALGTSVESRRCSIRLDSKHAPFRSGRRKQTGARAIENQAFVIGLNRAGADGNGVAYPGSSQVYDALGELVCGLGGEEECRFVTLDLGHVRTTRTTYPFQDDADPFELQPR